ncbi:unnamed protein product [Dimorphilus gyrociliatus]|uniref:G-protein coupled receptors family 1 profile domain-containing protein n=1 Tax=Dimorphilus gyrociliatus TaxID=2664684 RepID=A0A7I8V900_9ANNE|nr:unnamed protein product [Dimorphilus gyrociliatus]
MFRLFIIFVLFGVCFTNNDSSFNHTIGYGMDDSTTGGNVEPPPKKEVIDVISDELQKIISYFFGVVGILGNVLVIIVLYAKSMKIHDILLVNQSCVDLYCSIILIIYFAMNIFSDDFTPDIPWAWVREIYCRFWHITGALWGGYYASTLNLCLMTAERYIAIIFPLKHQRLVTKHRIKITMFIVWFWGLGYGIFFIGIPAKVNDNRNCIAWIDFPSEEVKNFYGMMKVIIEWLVPFIFLIVTNIHMAYKIRQQNTMIKESDAQQKKKFAAQKTLFKTLLLVTVGFAVCNSFNAIYFMMLSAGNNMSFGDVYQMSVLFHVANAIINPPLYTLQYDKFRRKAVKMFCGCLLSENKEKKSESVYVSSTSGSINK